jgi:ribosomal protein S13
MNYLNINKNKNSNLIYYLRNIYGIGYLSSKLICKILGYDVNVKTNELNQTD